LSPFTIRSLVKGPMIMNFGMVKSINRISNKIRDFLGFGPAHFLL
jgi:hypothetical protein